jgi:ubiquinone/menaquinone biosynthesis C-methylase UbiE
MKRAHAGSYHDPVIYQHPLAYLVGLEGVALLRAFAGEYDRDFTEARLAEIAALLHQPAQFGDGADVPPVSTAEGYGAWADNYDRPGNRLIELEQPIVRQIVDRLPPGTALDAACGTGRHAGYLASLGHTVTGVDGSAQMLAIARAKFPAAEFREGDLRRLPVPDQHADLVVCALALCHVQDLAPVMAEFAIVLRPGGHLVISDTRGMLSQLGTPVVQALPGGGYGYLPNHTHLASDYLAAALPLGLQVRGCEPRFPHPVIDPGAASPEGPVPGYNPADHYSLQPRCAAATDAAYRYTPVLIIWHFQLGAGAG